MLRSALLRRAKVVDSRIIYPLYGAHRTICTPTPSNTKRPTLSVANLTEDERTGRDLAKLAKLVDVLRQGIQQTARENNPPADHLITFEQDVNEAVDLLSNTLEKLGHPCTVEELGDRIDTNIIPVPVEALDYRDFLRAQSLRDSIEETVVGLQIFPPENTWLEGSGKLFDKYERKALRKQLEEGVTSEKNGNDDSPVVEEEAVLKELRPVSEEELAKRKAYLERSVTMEEVLRGFDTALLEVTRTHKVVKEGTTISMRALVAIGNRKGLAGYGQGKSDTAQHAIERACRDAKKNLLQVQLHQGRTIYHRVRGKFIVSEVVLWPAPAGTGISANNNFATVFELFGLKDIGAKLHGSRCLGNGVKALFNALSQIKSPEEVAQSRGLQEIVRPRLTSLAKGGKRRKLRAL